MKRIVDSFLLEWKDSQNRKPLLMRGARQVGKTHSIRQLGKQFSNFVEINFESDTEFKNIFDLNLDPVRIVRDLALMKDTKIEQGETLIFFDEIQAVPKALTALRYFYEKMPNQHIMAAGSLLDFTIQTIGIPVGRVSSLYMYPMSFFEFLCACGHNMLAQAILASTASMPMSEMVHQKILKVLGEYLAIGGMPEAVDSWQKNKDVMQCFRVHNTLIDTYQQDFGKYAEKFQIKYLEKLFDAVPRQLGTKFKYSSIEGDYRKRELAPCLDLLTTAGVVHPIFHSSGNGVPVGAEADVNDFKVIFLDVALAQAMLGLDLRPWLFSPEQEFINKGALVEAFIGQELLAYSNPHQRSNLFYWRRNTHGSEAEVDYIVQCMQHVVPVEVKSGQGSTLKSMHMFLESHQQSPYGIRFSTHNYSTNDKIQSYPLYSVINFALARQIQESKAYQVLCD